MTNKLKGGLVCFCYVYDEILDVPKDKHKMFMQYKDEKFVTDGCSKVAGFRLGALIYGIKLSIIIVILNSIL